MLTFDAVVTIDSSGPLHCLTLEDDEYIVGEGVCIPVKEGKRTRCCMRYRAF